MNQPTAPQIQRVIDNLINRRDNNAIPAGVSRSDFDTTVATLRNFIIDDHLSERDEDDAAPEGSQKCDECGTGLVDKCLRCGAPQCCPKCCREAQGAEEIRSHGD